MADILFDIEVTGIKELKDAAANFERLGKVSAKLAAQYKPLGAQTTRVVKEQKRLEASHRTLAKAVEAGRITQAQANRAYEEERRVTKERILTDKNLIAQQNKKAKAEQQSRRETERLTKAYAPARVAADLYQKKLKEIDKAAQRGVISQREAAKAAQAVSKDFKEFTSGLATGGNQFAKFNVAAYKANQATKRFASVGLQQAGYQIGDFAVQMQSGANIAVAFGQQMSQLLGIFGAGGALAGAGVAIGTAIIAPMIEMRKQTQGLKDDLNEVFSTLKDNKATTAELIDMSFTGPLEKSRLKAIEVLKIFEELDKNAARQQVARGALGLIGELEGLSSDAKVKASGNLVGLGKAKTKEGRTAAGQLATEIDTLIVTLGKAAVGPVEGLGDRLQDVFLEIQRLGFGSDKLSKDFKALIADTGILDNVTEKLRRAEEARAKAAEKTADNIKKAVEAREDERQLALEENNRRIKLQERLKRLNDEGNIEESIKIYKERKRQEELFQKTFIKNADVRYRAEKRVYDNALLTAVQIYRDRLKSEEEFNKDYLNSHERRYRLEKKRLDLQLTDAVEIYKRRMKAEEEATKESYEERARIAKSQEMRNAASMMAGPLFIDMGMLSDAAKTRQSRLDEDAKIFQQVEDYINTLENRLSKERQLKAFGEEELQLQSALIDARQKYGATASKSQMELIENTIRLIELEKVQKAVLEEAQKTQERVSESLGSSLEAAMMSIVDGTASVKDAFKEMAAAVIKDLYRILVVEQLVASFKVATGPFAAAMGTLGVANGAAFSGGSPIKAYANGGVVGGPTYFPMRGNRVGLMGEAGPEAIMPLSRGKDGKLGVQSSGQAVTVNQNINISTGVQQTVRTEIKSLMPQIAEASKAAVSDAKRRGGSYGRTFS